MRATTVLLLGGDAAARKAAGQAIAAIEACQLEQAAAETISARVQQGGVSLVLLHVEASADVGVQFALLQSIRERWRSIPIVVMEEGIADEHSLEFLRLGAVECLSRPFNVSRLKFLVDLLTVRSRCTMESAPAVTNDSSAVEHLDGLVVASKAARELVGQIRRVAPLDSTILLTGETGTGKTALARLVHNISPRRNEPFLALNCGALSPTLIESEMFGHKRGAFTGADQDRIGKFEAVREGTLLLDEIDALPPALQGKLLRAVEERAFEAVGSNESRTVRARLIAATNRSLADEVGAGRFRADLYFRLNVIDFHVPPLRERREAIPHLANKYLTSFAAAHGGGPKLLSAPAQEALGNYSWPGNIRELRNVIERAVALCPENTIELHDLPEAVRACWSESDPQGATIPLSNGLAHARREAERSQLADALRRNKNNRSHAAADLGISRVTLYKKLRKHKLG
jgi:DNA-binding NtrC family response regulator